LLKDRAIARTRKDMAMISFLTWYAAAAALSTATFLVLGWANGGCVA